ncbi:hypothetical protein JCM10550A_10610 [Methanogenium cariaci]
MTNYKGVKMTRGEANRLRAADPNGLDIVPVGTPPKVPCRATTKPPEPPEGGDDPTPEDNHPVVIPPQLHGCRFILLKPKRKEPLEYWKEQNYAHDSPRLLQHIRQGGNYGVMVTGDLCVLDADNVPALYDEPFFSDLIENSFMVSTGRAPIPGAHIYFRCPDLPPIKTVLKTATDKDLGDVRGPDSMTYVVGPGSIHPDTGKTYEITNDVAPVTVPLEKVRAFIDRYDVKKKAKTKRTAEARTDAPQRHNSANISESLGLKVTDFLMPENPQYRGDEIIGNHPIHGGDTGTNLSVNPHKNEWRCWHHESGGGPLEALAVADRIIDCSEAGPGCLEGHWPAVFDALDRRGYGPQREKMNRERKQQATGPRGPIPARATAEPEPEGADPEVLAEAERVLTEEDPLAYFLEVFHTSHVGDDIVAKCCYLCAASRVVATSKGLHVLTIGPSGKGKSSTYDTVLEQMPDRCKVEGSLSDKALLYHNHPEGSIIVRDDKEMSDALQELFRGATSDIRKPYKHHTVLNGKPTTHIFPARCVWWLAATEDTTDDQFHNRCLQPYVDDSKEADRAFTEHFLRSLAEGAKKDPRFTVCRYMWEMISSEVLPVWVWFSEAIKYDTESNRRNTTIFADMIQAVTRMRYKQRKIDPDRGIVASMDDYATAYEIYSALFGDEGSQGTQLTPDEARVLGAMYKMTTDRVEKITLNSLVSKTGITTDKVRRAIHGRKDRNHNPGLLSKCPALTFEKKNTSIPGTDGVTRSTTKNEYTLDERAYIAWNSHGGISLIPDIIEKSLVAHIARTFPTLCPQMGKAIIGTYGASFPNLTNIIINNNYNNNTLPNKEMEREDKYQREICTRLTPSLSQSGNGQSEPEGHQKNNANPTKSEPGANTGTPTRGQRREKPGTVGKATTGEVKP